MYKCNCCGKKFDHPRAVEESRGEFWGMPAYETMYYCPICGSEDYDDWFWFDADDEEDEEEC